MQLQAAIFDVDGVILDTARVHAAAWKDLFDDFLADRAARTGGAFQPFDEAADYLTYVDGRPRAEGIRAFLASRGITLPEGEPDDPPERETIAGLGHRKNLLFLPRLERSGIPIDRAAVSFIRELRARGVAVGVATSSRNALQILKRAGLDTVFDVSIDGEAVSRLGLAGKPAPDIFIECLRQLGIMSPDRSMVVEDAVAGVEAARRGGFGLTLGIDRGGHRVALRQHGADWVISSFEEISTDRVEQYLANRQHARPNALADWHSLERRVSGRKLAVFLDYDGTLTPIVERPELAVLSDEMRAVLRKVAAAWPTMIVSGRGRDDVASLVGVEELTIAASHGFDIAGPAAGRLRHEVEPGIAPAMDDAAAEVRMRTEGIPGVLVETKRFSVAVHYRLAPEDRIAEIERIVDAAVSSRPGLKKALGKKVFELRPAFDWDKGKAVLWLLDALELNQPDVLPVFIGDDVTDEDAFRALADRGIGIVVMDVPRPTAAVYSLQDVHEVQELLGRFAGMADTMR